MTKLYLPCGAALTTNDKVACLTFNLNPMQTCVGKPCFGKGCYGLGGVLNVETGVKGPRHDACVTSWGRNYVAVHNKTDEFCVEFAAALNKRKPAYFRWLSIGDLTPTLASVIDKVTPEIPGTKFLLFTKEFKLGNRLMNKHKNLRVIFSTWPGWKQNSKAITKQHTLVVPDKESIPKGYFTCPGACEECRACWNTNKNVAFIGHGAYRNKIWKKS